MVKYRWRKRKHGNQLGWWTFDNLKEGQVVEGWDIDPKIIELQIFQRVSGKNKGLYTVQIWKASTGKAEESQFFKTKPQAQAFAIKWMRKHPRG